MALTRITKGVIKPNENYDTHNINSTGIVTAIGLDVNGNGDISGNLSVGGVLTYEDVTSIDSVGIITAQKDIHVGAGVSAVGVGTFGGLVSPYADIDDFLDVGSNIQLGNAGVVTATTFKGDGDFVDIDVDGHTNLDNVSIAGVTTTNTLHVAANNTTVGAAITQSGSGDILKLYDGTSEVFTVANQDDGVGAVTISSPKPRIVFNETNGSPDYQIRMNGGIFTIHDSTNDIGRISITSSRTDINNPVLLNNDTVWIGDKLVHWTDDDTAIRFPSANTISAETAGTEAFRIDSRGYFDLGRDYSSNPQNGLVGIVTVRGHRVNEAGDYARLHFKMSTVGGQSSSSIRAFRDGGSNYSNGLAFYTHRSSSSSGDGTEKLRITADGQIGVNNASPDAWHSTYRSIQIYDGAVLYGSADDSFVGLGANHFLNTSGDFKYSNTDFASRFYQVNGGFHFESAASGTAGNTFSFSEKVRITASGVVNIAPNNLSQNTYKFQVETGTNKFISFGNAAHDDLGSEASAIVFSRASDGAKQLCGIFAHGTSLGMSARTNLTFHAGGTSDYEEAPERVRIDSTGKLGFGMTPDTWHTNNQKVFQISGTNAGLNIFTRAGSAHLSSNFIYNSSDAGVYQAASGYAMHHAVSATNGTFDWFSSSAASSSAGSSATLINRLRITQSGKVGINQDNPSTILHVKHTNNNTADITIEGGGTGNAGLQLIPGGQTNKYFAYVDTNRNFRIQDHTAERLRILAGGRVLIGNGNYYTPQGMLHIVGDDNSNGPELYLQIGNNNITDNIGALIFGNNIDKTVCMIRGSTHTATNTGDIEFHTSESGTLSEKLRIKNNGQVNFVRRNQANPFPAGNGTFTGISLDTDGGDIATGRIYIQGYQKNANSDYLTGFNNEGSTLVLYDYANTHYKQKWHKNGGTELYFTTTNRLETTSTGVDITGILDISVTKDTTALIIDGATSGTAYGETGGRIDFKMRNQVNQLTGDPAARVASYLDRGNNGFGLRFSTRYDASTFVNMVQISADYEFEPCLDSTVNLGSEDRTWNNAYIKDMYPDHSNESAMSGNYTAGSWYSTGFYRDNMGGLDTNGTYIVTCFSDTYAAGGGNYSTTTTWIVGVRDQYSNQTQIDSVPRLSTTAHSTNGQYFDLATRRYPSSSYSGREELVWKSTHNMTNINNNGGRLIRFRVQRIGRSST